MVGQLAIPVLIALAALASFVTGKLTGGAAVAGAVLALLLHYSVGIVGPGLLAAFFLLGTLATRHKHSAKQKQGLAEQNRGRRTVSQVFANAGAPVLVGVFVFFSVHFLAVAQLAIAAGFASATADTLSSEMGNVYGKRFYNIVSWRKDQRGRDGVISLEGTLFGLAGSLLIALVYSLFKGFDKTFLIVVVSGTFGNLFDSILGATAERHGRLGNNAVNFLNTTAAIILALAVYLFTDQRA